MYATKQSKITDSTVTVDTKTLTELLHCGRVTAIKVGTAAQARIQVDKRVLWHLPKIYKYLEQVAAEK